MIVFHEFAIARYEPMRKNEPSVIGRRCMRIYLEGEDAGR